jgi:CHASE3 domain sensor protein
MIGLYHVPLVFDVVKPLSKLLSTRQLILLGMTIPIGLLLVVGGLQWQSVRSYAASREWVIHTRVVLTTLESFLSDITKAETSQRNYLLTHQESYLAPYQAAAEDSRKQFRALRRLTADNAAQQQKLDQLEPLVNAELDQLAQATALEKNLDHAGAVKLASGDGGKTSDQIQDGFRQMHDIERRLLQEREVAYQRMGQINSNLSMLLIAIGFGFVIAIGVLLRRMEQMEEMIKICAWSKMIEYNGEWLSIEEYLSQRLHARITHGVSQAEAERMLKLLEKEKLKEAA